MAIGERIKFIRKLRKLTMKQLGSAIAFNEMSADVRIAQYESGTRTPKDNYVNALANALEVLPQALNVPNIESIIGVMHTLFVLEDLYGININSIEGELCITLDKTKGDTYLAMYDVFNKWQKGYAKLQRGNICKAEYDNWRYNRII